MPKSCEPWEQIGAAIVTRQADKARAQALTRFGDEELIAEVERRGYVVICRQVLCGECGEMRSVSPQEAGQGVTCECCGEKIAPPIPLPGKEHDVPIAGAA
jgi:ribosomal protein S27E